MSCSGNFGSRVFAGPVADARRSASAACLCSKHRSSVDSGDAPTACWGAPVAAWNAGGEAVVISEGENLEVDRPRRLVQSFNALWSDAVKSEGTTRVTWEIEEIGDSCKLTVTHDQLREDANSEIYGGWPMILSGLKTLLETGELLTTPGSLMYVRPEAGE